MSRVSAASLPRRKHPPRKVSRVCYTGHMMEYVTAELISTEPGLATGTVVRASRGPVTAIIKEEDPDVPGYYTFEWEVAPDLDTTRTHPKNPARFIKRGERQFLVSSDPGIEPGLTLTVSKAKGGISYAKLKQEIEPGIYAFGWGYPPKTFYCQSCWEIRDDLRPMEDYSSGLPGWACRDCGGMASFA